MQLTKHGDTIIEVVFAFAVFATVSVAAIAIMNSGLDQAQRSLEGTMARNEVNAQADAIKFIHNSAVSERGVGSTQYSRLWNKITGSPISVNRIGNDKLIRDVNRYKNCDEVYNGNGEIKGQVTATEISNDSIFAINPRYLIPEDSAPNYATNELKKIVVNKASSKLFPPSLYPRIIFSENDDENLKTEINEFAEAKRIEGIWVFAVKGGTASKTQYYDFYIRTCWQSASKSLSTISTIVRVYDPELLSP